MSKQVKFEVLDGEDQTVVRGRPGRRSAEDRKNAVLEILSGKATLEQVARRLGVSEATVKGWQEEAAEAIANAFRQGTSKPAREQELEKENRTLRDTISTLSVENHILERAVESRPTRPGKSPK